MVEVMVALVIFTVSLLGLAGLQAASLRDNQSAYQSTVAAQLVSNMGERIRANPEGAAAGNYLVNSSGETPPGAPAVDCYAGSCTPAQIAATDTYEWLTAVAERLPSGIGQVASSGETYAVTVAWRRESGGTAGTGCNATEGFTCLRIEVRP